MTIRAFLDRRLQRIITASFGGIGLFLAGMVVGILANEEAIILATTLPGFFIAFMTMMVGAYCALRCPRCRGNLAPTIFGSGGFSVDLQLRCCPFCGVGL